jgi:hypothetical protein
MRLQPETIRLGSFTWVVRPLTLRQVQEIEPILMEGAVGVKGNIGAALAIVGIALRRDDPDDAARLWDIEATAPEIGTAMGAVLRLGGFIQSNDTGVPSSGEVVAGASTAVDSPASTSQTSTPA